jgi:multiple sugar transport system substrate-binding protein
MEGDKLALVKRVAAFAFILFLTVFAFSPRATKATLPGRIPVRFWHMWTAEWADVVNEIAADYNSSQSVYEVIPLSIPSSGADTKFQLAVTGGDPPDLMAQWNAVIPTWADSRLIQPLDDLMTKEELATFNTEAYPIVKKLGMYKGKLYGLTIGINGFALYLLPEQLEAQGLDPNNTPTSLEELTKWGDKLTKVGAGGSLDRLGFLPLGFTHAAALFGGGFYDWKSGEVKLNTAENLRALEYLTEERRKVGYENYIRFQSGLNTASFAGGWPFIGGAYSICGDGQWRVEQLRRYSPDLKYLTVAMPPPKGGRQNACFSGGNFMIIPSGAKNSKGAWDFIKFWSGLMEPDRAAKFYTMGGWLPLSPKVAQAPLYQKYLQENPQFKTFVDLMPSESLEALPPVPYQVFLMDRVNRAEDLALRGTKTPKEALEELEKDVKDERRRRKELGYAE